MTTLKGLGSIHHESLGPAASSRGAEAMRGAGRLCHLVLLNLAQKGSIGDSLKLKREVPPSQAVVAGMCIGSIFKRPVRLRIG